MIKLLLCSAASAALMTAAGHAHDGAHMAANAASVSSAAAQAETQAEETETERLYAYFQQVFMDEVARSPETQTYLGMIEDTEAYGRWDDRSDSAQIENYERGQRQTEEMQARFDREALTDAARCPMISPSSCRKTMRASSLSATAAMSSPRWGIRSRN